MTGREGIRAVRRDFLDVASAAALLNTSERFVRRLIAERRVAFHRIGRHIRLDAHDLQKFAEHARVEPMDPNA